MNDREKGTSITLSLLLVAFIVLKLCGVISWSWIWVLAPVWAPVAVWLIAFGFVCFMAEQEKKRKEKSHE